MKRFMMFCLCVFILLNKSYATSFPQTKTTTYDIEGINSFRIYDGVGNLKTLNLDRTSPLVSEPTYDGDDYLINISDDESGIWKVVDDNGIYETDAGTFRHSIYGVNQITVYDHANNKTTVSLEKTPPTVTTPTYANGKYTITVQDNDSGIWKIKYGDNEEIISAGEITRDKIPSEDMVYVYDKANNVTMVNLTNDKPRIVKLNKRVNSNNIELVVTDNNMDLWKITETIGGPSKVALSGRSELVNLETSSRTIYVYNQSGNYTRVDLSEYETNNFDNIKQFTIDGINFDEIYVYDGVGNLKTVRVDRIPPVVSEPTYEGDNYVINISDNEAGIWKVVDDNGEYETTAGTFKHSIYGVINITVYDNANNTTTVPVENTPPIVSTPRYEGDNYVIDISDSDSGIWKVVDDNGTYITTAGTFKHSIYNVTSITVYDKANNSTTVSLENTSPTVSNPTYANGKYTITVQDNESGIWKIKDSNGESIIGAGSITRYKKNGEETVYVYDKAGNVTTLGLTTTKPKVLRLAKRVNNLNVSLDASDSNMNLWKVTETIGGNAISTLTGKKATVNFALSSEGVREIFVYNQAGNYTRVSLDEYEVSNFGNIQECTMSGVKRILVYDAVNNVKEQLLDSNGPTISEPTYREGKYTITVSDDDAGVWKIEDSNGTIETGDGVITRTKISGNERVYAYDHAGNTSYVDLTTSTPQVVSLQKYTTEASILLTAKDDNVDLWKVTETPNGNPIALLSGRNSTVGFMLTSNSVRTIYVHNHAGNYLAVNLSSYEVEPPPHVDEVKPEVVGTVYRNEAGTGFKVSATDDEALGKITKYDDTFIKNIFGTSYTTNFEVESAIDKFKVYDKSDNFEVVESFTVDKDAPSVTRDGNNLIIMDSVSGLWKVTNEDGSIVLKSFEGTYPTTQETYTIGLEDDVVLVYDAVGNYTRIDLRKEVSGGNVTISQDELKGIKVTGDATITFANMSKIAIGRNSGMFAGIEVGEGVTLTINNTSEYPINIYGGRNGNVKYAGIYVPQTSRLNIIGSGTMNVYGNWEGNGTGAGIGGNGVTINSSEDVSTEVTNAGYIKISSGVINAFGGYSTTNCCGLGAGIGGGGIYNTYSSSVSGSNLGNIIIEDTAKVTARGGYTLKNGYGLGAGIGGGGICNTIATNVTGGNLVDGIISSSNEVLAEGGYVLENGHGMGSGIGGGGVYNTKSGATVVGGSLKKLIIISSDVEAIGGYGGNQCYGLGAGIGGGGVSSTQNANVLSGQSIGLKRYKNLGEI